MKSKSIPKQGDPKMWGPMSEVTLRYGIGRSALYRLIREGKLRTVKLGEAVGATRLIEFASVERLLDELWELQQPEANNDASQDNGGAA